MTAVTTTRQLVNASTRKSTGTANGSESDRAPAICVDDRASRIPGTAALDAISALSISSCRTTRRRVAPSDTRSAISLRRAAPRASSMFATFAHATSKTIAGTLMKIRTEVMTSLIPPGGVPKRATTARASRRSRGSRRSMR